MKKELETHNQLIISYMTLRKAIGILGVALPFVVSLGALIIFQTGLQGSLSSYYYTGMRDVFVGILWAIGIFLLSYKGFDRIDNIATSLGCLFAVGVSLFPTTPEANPSLSPRWIGNLHFIFAALFFFTLIYISLFLFTKTDPKKQPTQGKLHRNIVYKICGYVMAACILLIAIYHFLPAEAALSLKALAPVYWLETIAIITFGVSWLTKGETIFKDDAKEEKGQPA